MASEYSTEVISKLLRVRKTVAQMLNDRGYLVSDEDLNMNFEEFKEKFATSEVNVRDRMMMLHRHKDNAADQLFVFFPEEKKVSVKFIRSAAEHMKQEKTKRAIIVAQAGMTPFAKSVLTSLEEENFNFEQFVEDELLVNITKHVLVPTHVVLSDAEKAELLKKYKLKDTQLPRIQHSDPVARYFGMNRGQVVKITRASETAGCYVTYRLVI